MRPSEAIPGAFLILEINMITIATWFELRAAIERHPATAILRTHLDGLEEFEDQPLNELCEFIFAEPTDSINDLERRLGRALRPPPWEYADQTDGWYELVLVTGDDGSGYVVLVEDQPDSCSELVAYCKLLIA